MSWPSTVTVPARRRDDPAHDADQRGLAGAVRSEQGEDLAAPDLEVDVLQRLEPGRIGLRHAGNGDDRHCVTSWFGEGRASDRAGARERPAHAVADLRPVTQIVIRDHACHHGFADRNRADPDARVVAALGDDLGLVAVAVDRLARRRGSRRSASRRNAPRPPGRSRCRRECRLHGWPESAGGRHCPCASRRRSPRRSSRRSRTRRRSRHPSRR